MVQVLTPIIYSSYLPYGHLHSLPPQQLKSISKVTWLSDGHHNDWFSLPPFFIPFLYQVDTKEDFDDCTGYKRSKEGNKDGDTWKWLTDKVW